MGYGSSSRGGANVIWACIHTAEGARTARALASFFNGNQNASSHAGLDASETLPYVPYYRAAWTLGPGNPYSDNLEICGFAGWTRSQWLSTGVVDGCANPREMVRKAAVWAKQRCDARGIPYRMLGASAVSGWQKSVIDHDDYTEGSNWGSHWDVGEGFPFDVFLADFDAEISGGGGVAHVMDWPIKGNEYFGPKNGPANSIGGFYAAHRPQIRIIQQKFQELGHAPSYSGWADGIWEKPTTVACKAWERAAGQKVDGIITENDWDKLFPQEDDMSEEAERKIDDLHKWFKGFNVESVKNPYYGKTDTENETIWAGTALDWITGWLHNFLVESVANPTKSKDTNPMIWARTALDWDTHWIEYMRTRWGAMEARQEATLKAVAELSNDPNVTAEFMERVLREAVAENMPELPADIDVSGELSWNSESGGEQNG